jgi:flagellar biosynthesis anti-sigma factor FlgM
MEGLKLKERVEDDVESAVVGLAAPGAGLRNNAAAEIADDPDMLSLAGRLISAAAGGSDVRYERVAALRQAIEAGTYGVSSSDLADKLVGVMRR